MDIFSLAVGFVTGGLTGAASTYLGNKYTDQRRSQEAQKKSKQKWFDLKKQYPDLISEMQRDVRLDDKNFIRTFFICEQGMTINKAEPAFEYYSDKHPGINDAIMYMQELDYIQDITTGNCPMYRFKNNFYDLLRKY